MKGSRGKYLVLPFLLCILFIFSVAPASAVIISFEDSTVSVNNDGIDSSLVDATAEFEVYQDNLDGTGIVTLTITNLSSHYTYKEFNFNVTDNITSLAINSYNKKDKIVEGLTGADPFNGPNGVPFWDLKGPKNVNGFGDFDYEMTDSNTKEVGIGESYRWYFDVIYTGSLSDMNFLDLSTGGEHGAQHAAVHAKNDITGWAGANMTVIPEPASLLLLGTGVVGLLGLRRKMKN